MKGDGDTRYGPKPKSLEDLFWSKVHKSDGCWLWIGALNSRGYGILCRKGKAIRAHRIMWQLMSGPIPDSLFVLHKCDNRKCVNPDHLFLGTQTDNMADMNRKGRNARGEKNRHAKLTEAKVIRMRRLRKQGWLLKELSIEFGVGQPVISEIVRGKKWTHVN